MSNFDLVMEVIIILSYLTRQVSHSLTFI